MLSVGEVSRNAIKMIEIFQNFLFGFFVLISMGVMEGE